MSFNCSGHVAAGKSRCAEQERYRKGKAENERYFLDFFHRNHLSTLEIKQGCGNNPAALSFLDLVCYGFRGAICQSCHKLPLIVSESVRFAESIP